MNSRAAVLYGPKQPLRIEDIEVDDPKPGEVLLRLTASGICHSDLSPMQGLRPAPYPIVLGHEGAGMVEKVGSGVTSVKPGDHAIAAGIAPCGKCAYCVVGRPKVCQANLPKAVAGTLPDGTKRFHTKDGTEISHFLSRSSFTQYTVVAESGVVKVRPDAPLDKVALLSCGAAAGIGTVLNACRPEVGSTIAIFGCGGLGLSAVMAARIANCRMIIAVDVQDSKLQMAKELGATHIVNGKLTDAVQEVHKITGGGADNTLEFTGNVEVMSQTFDAAKAAGSVYLAGAPPAGARVSLDARALLLEKRVTGVVGGDTRSIIDIPRWVDLFMEGKLPIERLITHTFAFRDVNMAIELLEKGEGVRSILVID